MFSLYDIIMSLCYRNGIKGGKLCTDIGMSKGILTDLKMGRQTGISAGNAQKIATYFGVTVDYVLGRDLDAWPLILKYKIDKLEKELRIASSDRREEIEKEIAEMQKTLFDVDATPLEEIFGVYKDAKFYETRRAVLDLFDQATPEQADVMLSMMKAYMAASSTIEKKASST